MICIITPPSHNLTPPRYTFNRLKKLEFVSTFIIAFAYNECVHLYAAEYINKMFTGTTSHGLVEVSTVSIFQNRPGTWFSEFKSPEMNDAERYDYAYGVFINKLHDSLIEVCDEFVRIF